MRMRMMQQQQQQQGLPDGSNSCAGIARVCSNGGCMGLLSAAQPPPASTGRGHMISALAAAVVL
jgi:hypothetical protein